MPPTLTRVRAMMLDQVSRPTPPATEGFDRVFEEHVSYVRRALRRLGVQDADVDDVSQEVFLVVHRRLPTFERRSSFATWLYGICIRAAAGYRRRSHRRHEATAAIPPEQSIPADQHDELVRRRDLALLDDILDQLDDDKRAIFVLHELEQVPMTEVAEASGCPLQTAYSRLYAARRHVEAAVRRAELARKRSGRGAASLGVMFPWMLPSTLSGALVGGGLAAAVLLGVFWHSARLSPRDTATIAAPVMIEARPRAAGARPRPPEPSTRGDTEHESRATEARRASGAAPSAPLPSPDDAEVAPDKDAEMLLLQRAKEALAARPAEALALADAHVARFPGGALSQERELFAITALAALGRAPEARARAAQFFARFPSSAYRQRIEFVLSAPGARD